MKRRDFAADAPVARCADCGKVAGAHKGWLGAECQCGPPRQAGLGHSIHNRDPGE